MKTRLLFTLACAALAAFIHPANAAPGDLDLTFGGSGKVTTAIGSSRDAGQSVAVQDDGKILVAGYANFNSYDFALVRYNANGTLDTSFNGTGKVTTDFGGIDIGYSVALQADGKIVVAGTASTTSNADFALARYNANGTLDTSFGDTGKVTTAISNSGASGTSLALQSDGKILVAGDTVGGGQYDFALVRYDFDGSLDTSFNGNGKVTTDLSVEDFPKSVLVQSDGKIVVAGYSWNGGNYDFALVRYNANGTLDMTFNGTGKVTTDFGSANNQAYSVALQKDGKIVVAGYANFNSYDFALVRYNTNGTRDTSFNGTGKVTADFDSANDGAASVALQSDGKILVAGYATVGGNVLFAVVRYDGSPLDTDGDGIPDVNETGTGIYVSPTDTGTSPTNPDTDGDGLNDGEEVNRYHSNPNVKDTDGDGFDDGFEVSTGFDPTSGASTPDAQSSIRTAVEYRFNAALGVSYRIEASTDLTTWTTIETNIIGTGGAITRFYSIEGQARRYYRSRRN